MAPLLPSLTPQADERSPSTAQLCCQDVVVIVPVPPLSLSWPPPASSFPFCRHCCCGCPPCRHLCARRCRHCRPSVPIPKVDIDRMGVSVAQRSAIQHLSKEEVGVGVDASPDNNGDGSDICWDISVHRRQGQALSTSSTADAATALLRKTSAFRGPSATCRSRRCVCVCVWPPVSGELLSA